MTASVITITNTDGWVEIPVLNSYVHIINVQHNDMYLRVGTLDITEGIAIEEGNTSIKSDVPLYARFKRGDNSVETVKTVITILKD